MTNQAATHSVMGLGGHCLAAAATPADQQAMVQDEVLRSARLPDDLSCSECSLLWQTAGACGSQRLTLAALGLSCVPGVCVISGSVLASIQEGAAAGSACSKWPGYFSKAGLCCHMASDPWQA